MTFYNKVSIHKPQNYKERMERRIPCERKV